MARHRRSGTIISGAGRHARPCKAAHAAAAAGGSIAAGAIMAGSVTAAQAQPVLHPVTAPHAASTAVVTDDIAEADVIVISGDTLSGISRAHCGTPDDWTGIYSRNEKVIGDDYNLILPGQKLVMSCRSVQVAQTAAVTAQDSQEEPQQAQPVSQPVSQEQVSTAGMGAFQACVISRESGGNSQVMNASGHYGLYQFDFGTWVSGGGNPADFGHASAEEQDRVFAAVYAARGTDPWAPYDGC